MASHSLRITQTIPASRERVWEFFSNPANLRIITPEAMQFMVVSKFHGEKIYAGQIIEYTLRPLLGIRVYWMTEITHVEEGVYFVDEQRFGPYRYWHHQHHFRDVEGGVEMTDILHYRNPFGFIGRIANSLFVRKKVEEIFEYRRIKINEIFF